MVEFNYKTLIGPSALYDYSAGFQFSVLFKFGLRARHKFLDYGCGDLRVGRLLLQYLSKGNYYGIEPNEKRTVGGIKGNHLHELVTYKRPHFRYSGDCDMSAFEINFDYILAYAVFIHMSDQQIKSSLASAYKAMHGESIFLATYIEDLVNKNLKSWNAGDTARYSQKTIFNLIRENGLLPTPLNLMGPGEHSWLLIRKKT